MNDNHQLTGKAANLALCETFGEAAAETLRALGEMLPAEAKGLRQQARRVQITARILASEVAVYRHTEGKEGEGLPDDAA